MKSFLLILALAGLSQAAIVPIHSTVPSSTKQFWVSYPTNVTRDWDNVVCNKAESWACHYQLPGRKMTPSDLTRPVEIQVDCWTCYNFFLSGCTSIDVIVDGKTYEGVGCRSDGIDNNFISWFILTGIAILSTFAIVVIFATMGLCASLMGSYIDDMLVRRRQLRELAYKSGKQP